MDYKCLSAGIAEQAVGAWRDVGKKAMRVMCCHVSLEMHRTEGLIGMLEREV